MAAFDISQKLDGLIDDRVDDGMFRVHRSFFHDADIYDAEMEAIFENNWGFLCHESQIPNPGDFFATHIGRQPVFAHRQQDGSIRAFANACSHRGAILTPLQRGNAKVLTCRFHGWSYSCDGRCLSIKNQDAGFPEEGFDRSHFDLNALADVGEYRGFVFGTLNSRAPSLEDHLGESRFLMDFFADQSPDGMEVLPGSQTYVCDHNWKLQAENVTDGYHVGTVHRNFMTTMLGREARENATGMMRTETGRIKGNVANGGYYLGNGHIALWADRASPDAAPLSPATDRIEAEFSETRAHWMLRRGRNVLVFPNMVLNDLASTHMRTCRPLGPTRCEVTIWCIAPRGEPAEARAARLRKFEDFFLVTGLATSDDVVSLDTAQAGTFGGQAGWNEYTRGITEFTSGPDEEARNLGMNPEISSPSWDHEAEYIGFYRHCRDLLRNHGQTAIAAE
ncbi:MAG: Rieske 2Fe-2S domain-containing protein [Pseudomonadota bacterium]|nr:Rieske 2Fe-2S domain-containing protein [Pseudomonadota bacterium]